jgi:hypothetical protein
MKVQMPRIELSEKHKIDLKEKHQVSLQTVRNALKYFSNSEKAQEIRQDAIGLLKEEAIKAEQLEN